MSQRFYVLHNPHDEDSRAFVEAHAADPRVAEALLWYPVELTDEEGNPVPDLTRPVLDGEGEAVLGDDEQPLYHPIVLGAGDRQRWVELGGTEQVSAFPAIVYEHQAYVELVLLPDEDDPDAEASVQPVEHDAGQRVVNWDPEVAAELRAEDVDPLGLHLFNAAQQAWNDEALAMVTRAEQAPERVPSTEAAVAAAVFLGAPRAEQAQERLDKVRQR